MWARAWRMPPSERRVLVCDSKVIGTLCFLVRSHAGPASDAQDPVGTSILLHLEEDAHPRVSLDIASCKGPLGRAEPDVAVQVNEVERINARSPVAGQGGDACDHRPPYDVEDRGIVSVHLAPPGVFRNPRRPS
jgi:hypothetical protein